MQVSVVIGPREQQNVETGKMDTGDGSADGEHGTKVMDTLYYWPQNH